MVFPLLEKKQHHIVVQESRARTHTHAQQAQSSST